MAMWPDQFKSPKVVCDAKVAEKEAALRQARAEQEDLETALQTARVEVTALEAACFRERECDILDTATLRATAARASPTQPAEETLVFVRDATGPLADAAAQPAPSRGAPTDLDGAVAVAVRQADTAAQPRQEEQSGDARSDTADDEEEYSCSSDYSSVGSSAVSGRSPKRARRDDATSQQPPRSSAWHARARGPSMSQNAAWSWQQHGIDDESWARWNELSDSAQTDVRKHGSVGGANPSALLSARMRRATRGGRRS